MKTTFDLQTRLHVPGEDGRIWDASVPVGTEWSPMIMRAHFLIAEADGAWTLLSPVKSARLRRTASALELECDGEPRAERFPSRAAALAAYRQRMPAQPARYCPDWLARVPGCVLIEMWTGTGKIKHTFTEVAALLEAMRAAGVPRETLVYFWGWFAPFDRMYPAYWPATEVGGEAGLDRLIATARACGYRLMPHANSHGFSTDHPDYPQFASERARARDGTYYGWREPGEPSIEYMRPNSPRWQAYLGEKLARFTERFPVDVLSIDQYGVPLDDPECDYDTAWLEFSGALQRACPTTVFAGELFHERCFNLPLWQQWGTPWCGLPVREEMPHTDLLGALFGNAFRSFGHMGMPAVVECPDCWPSFYWYIRHYGAAEATRRAHAWHQSVGTIPTARVNFREHGLDPSARAILRGEELPR